jgi:uncharacterized repeat protein (TIGR01451 family)
LIAVLAAPGAWATPGQIGLAQTVPTRTPTPGAVLPTVRPPNVTAVPPTAGPGASPTSPLVVPPAGTPAPAAGPLVLTKSADRRAAWPGATVTYTLVVRNSGAAALRQVSLEDALPRGLAPVAVLSGGATWSGSTLRLTSATLAPGARLEVVYTARVTATEAGTTIVNRARVSAAGVAPATATWTLALPPAELPATGDTPGD